MNVSKTLIGMISLIVGGINNTFSQSSEPEKPNIIFIMADDMGYGDPECYNKDSRIPTPNINQLARDGMLFTDAHSASSVCTPSRYSVINGKYAWKSNLKKEVQWSGYDTPLIDNKEITVADICKQAGYLTAAIGKWHIGVNFLKNTGNSFVKPKDHHENGMLGTRNVNFTTPTFGGPNDLGFDYFFGVLGGQNMEPFAFVRDRYIIGKPNRWREKGEPTALGISASEVHEGWMVDNWQDTTIGGVLTSEAEKFMERSVAEKKPFFMYFTPVAPHRPCTPSSIGKGKSAAGERGDMVYEFDWTVGQIRKKIRDLGIERNTIVIVTSDNGATKTSDDGNDYGHKSCGDLRGYKSALYEGGHRIPFILAWPAVVKPGTVLDNLISNLDFMATISDIIKIPMPNNKDSKSFAGILFDKQSEPNRRELIHHTYSGMYAMRDGSWKMIPNRKADGSWTYELYNITLDPNETVDRSKAYPEMVRRLNVKMESQIFDH